MEKLYVIVHEDVVRSESDFGIEEAGEVLQELDKIRDQKNKLEIPIPKLPWMLHPDMPLNKPDLQVLVTGANKWCCCSLQLYALRKNGYNANFYDPACYDGIGERNPIVFSLEGMQDAKEIIPEFFR